MAFPKKYKTIDGKRYHLRHRFETKAKAEDSAEYQRRMHSGRIGYSIRVVELPPSQWGMVDWDINKYATYEYLGRLPKGTLRGISELFA